MLFARAADRGNDENGKVVVSMSDESNTERLCNLCGLSCWLREGQHVELGGLIKATATGGYFSTPGNGVGALDDTVAYRFSLCEFCLDWLFGRFVVPVAVTDYMLDDTPVEAWKPAAERVAADDWRKMKQEFTDEAARRAAARKP